jgi:murein DD-endopeptidase MepM/ murein hydrolase activator NlpD
MGHEVAAGESIYSIAGRYGTTAEALAARNSIPPPYQLTVGQRLVLPAPSTYVVQAGETMDAIARRYGTTPAELARVNGIGAPYQVTPGQTLSIPQGAGASGAIAAVPATSGPVQVAALPPTDAPPAISTAIGATGPTQPPGAAPFSSATGATGPALPPAPPPTGTAGAATGAPIPLTDTQQPAMAAVGAPQTFTLQPPSLDGAGGQAASVPPALPSADPQVPAVPAAIGTADTAPPAAASAGSGSLPALSGSGFLKPVTGQVLTGFGEGSPVPNDGVNIAAPRGTPVQAAESGVVAYVGEDIDTFGNLVLIRHADGWVTAYGHADAILVGEGDVVTRGQAIARVGSTGNVAVPQLHFELRRGTEPVDPMAYLEG